MKLCENCQFFFYDNTTGTTDCNNVKINEQELQEHFTDEKSNCPYWERSSMTE